MSAMEVPMFQAGAFHVELIDGAYGVYDAFVNRVHLYFADRSEAEAAAAALAAASDQSTDALDAEYACQLVLARESMADAA